MATRFARRWPLALLLASFFTTGAYAQAITVDVTPDAPASVIAGNSGLVTGTVTADVAQTDVTLTFSALPAGVSFGDTTLPPGTSWDGNTQTFTVPTLGAAESSTILIELTVDPAVADGTVFTVTGQSASTEAGASGSDTTAEITVNREVDMEAGAVSTPGTVVAGSGPGNLVHVLSVTNNGPSQASGVELAVTPVIPAGVTIDDISADIGTWDPNTLVLSIPDHPVGVTANLTITLTVGPETVAGADVISATATVSSTETDTNPDNNIAVDPTTVEREVDLAVTAVDNPDPVLAGSGAGNLTHTLTISNNGPSQGSGVELAITPTIPAGVTIDNVSADIGTFDPNTLVLSIGDHPVGITATLVITLTVDNTASACTDCVSAEGTASANETDTNPGNDSAVDPTSIEVAEGAPTSFLTTIGFTNGYEGTVSVSISCNNGVPLDQTFDISPSQPVDFVVDLLDFVAPDVNCTISLDMVDDGYVGSFLANGVDTGDACVYSSEPAAGEAPFDNSLERSNTCEIMAEPVVSTFEVEKVWVFESNDTIEMTADIQIWCSPASSDTGPEFGTVSTYVTAYGDDSFTLQFYPDWDGGATCYAQESNLDSAVESDGGCADGTDFEIGDEEAGCTITNTVFFEGIPTLSQYGLALMALLMLGVGFVGLRRFV